MVTLQTVEIPGYADAIKRERLIRDRAFLGGSEIVCGVEVNPITVRRLIMLEHAGNGYVIPCRFIDDNEAVAHAMALLFFCRVGFEVPKSPRYSFVRSAFDGARQHFFIRGILRRMSRDDFLSEFRAWVEVQFMDAPQGSSERIADISYAAWPAYLIDLFAEAGNSFHPDEILDMPLARLWQHWRIAASRVRGLKLTNPSDSLAVEAIK